VLSGHDRRSGEDFVNQVCITANGGPGSAYADGWVTYGVPCTSGLMYRDSVEIDEIKMPIMYKHLQMVPDTGGAGKFRGGPSFEFAYTPKTDPISLIYPCDGQDTPSKGVAGGNDGHRAAAWLEDADGTRQKLPNTVAITLLPGQTIHGFDASGGGYGSPLERDPRLVLDDVLEGWETAEHATATYGVEFTHTDDGLTVDDAATALRRSQAPS
jgi:N-methylhydantoinase B